ncbi:MAG TPA: hypothetical protein VLA82_12010 [Actinomycetota bacterium]|nr:hypothetical protein [Actinomycetota bacterium]
MTADRPRTPPTDLAVVAALAAVLFVLFLFPFVLTHYPVPVGPDVPVYLWWARVGAAEGLSVVGWRPGTPALIPTVARVIGVGSLTSVAGLQYALGPAIGLAGAALIRGRNGAPRLAWGLGGLLTGIWAVHLGAGYLANLAFVACFVTAAAALAHGTRRGAAVATLLLAGGGLSHPQFFVVGAGILAVAAAWSLWEDRTGLGRRTDAGRTAAALGGSGAIVAAGLLSLLVGPAPIPGDTSKDAFLRRVGEWDALGRTYVDRFFRNPGRYAPWVSLPLAGLGAWRGVGGERDRRAVLRLGARGGLVRRFLLAWVILTVVAVPVALVTRWFPPDRMLTFAFCIPVLAALGLVWLCTRIPRRAWSVIVGVALVGAFAWAPVASWVSQRGFIGPGELAAAATAGRIAASLPEGTLLVFVVDDPASNNAFAASHALNVARAAVPPERARDVRVYVGDPTRLLDGESTTGGSRLFDVASATSLEDIPAGVPKEVFVVADHARSERAFADPRLVRWSPDLASTVPGPRPLPAVPGEPRPTSPLAMSLAALATFTLLTAIGYGWARWAIDTAAGAMLAAPACGIAALTIVAVAAERIGVPLDATAGALVLSAIAGGGGYALLAVRRPARRTSGGASVGEGETEVGAPAHIP